MVDFDAVAENMQIAWRRDNISTQENGTQNGVKRPWIVPPPVWQETVWRGVREGLLTYLDRTGVQKHKGVHNLKSSWVLCANLYFPFRQGSGPSLLAGFLQRHVSSEIRRVERVELEYAEPAPRDPQTLLGEPDTGTRGANQTSPDVAFLVETDRGPGLILTENKFTEHHFYGCSGRKPEVQNPDPGRCLAWSRLRADITAGCWQHHWATDTRPNRKYWSHLRLSEHGRTALTRCPAASDGYQLFRQQALAEALAATTTYALVASCVAYDERNTALRHCLRRTGVDDFTTGWGPLFTGRATFATWSHQDWVNWVRQQDTNGQWGDWLAYVQTRYGYGKR